MILSVLYQTFSNFELIIVNDGSTDGSLQIAEGISDSRIRIFDKPHSGVSSARNLGINNSRFDYIALLDGDDLWKPNYLEEMYNTILSRPDDLFFASNFQFIKNGKIVNPKLKIAIKENESAYLDYYTSFYDSKYSPIFTSAVIFHKRLFNKSKFRENIKSGQDLFLWIQFSLICKFVFLNKKLVYYNHDVDSSRAIGKLYTKESSYIFFLNEFEEEEKKNPSLKRLLDWLRMANLKPYIHIYPDEVRAILSKVSKMDFTHWVFYHLPRFATKKFYKI
jgi:glycosyltransferase involved in cell wall biosynthesis